MGVKKVGRAQANPDAPTTSAARPLNLNKLTSALQARPPSVALILLRNFGAEIRCEMESTAAVKLGHPMPSSRARLGRKAICP